MGILNPHSAPTTVTPQQDGCTKYIRTELTFYPPESLDSSRFFVYMA